MKLRYWILIAVVALAIAIHAIVAGSIDGGIHLLINNTMSVVAQAPTILASTVPVWIVLPVGVVICVALVIVTAKWERFKTMFHIGKRLVGDTGLPPLQERPVNTMPQQIYPNPNLQPIEEKQQ